MACYHPIPAFQRSAGEAPRLWPELGTENLALPCGSCLGCRTDKAREWAHRCGHETTRWPRNIFITLTYDDAHLPEHGYLDAAALTRFFKRLRKRAQDSRRSFDRNHRAGIRYFACGEYGEQTERPHYHAILFNCAFKDEKISGRNDDGTDLYTSATLRELWPFGHHKYGEANAAAAGYIAQYNLKKQWGGTDYYINGVQVPPPFLRMSRKPAIGTEWLAQYRDDLKMGYLVENARKTGIPRAYLKQLKKWEEKQRGPAKNIEHITERIEWRKELAKREGKDREDRKPERLHDKERIHKRRKELAEQRELRN